MSNIDKRLPSMFAFKNLLITQKKSLSLMQSEECVMRCVKKCVRG